MSSGFNILDEPALTYHTVADQDLYNLINTLREGIKFTSFLILLNQLPFNLSQWSGFLCLSDRTMQRYQKEGKKFDQSSSEKILEILLLYRYGVQVFMDKEKFNTWLVTHNVALAGKKPITFLDNTFGINLIKDELFRIEQGLLA
jgi:putative toxin-antitoxin system antitoxin component (TIGR02293 family)